MHARPGHRPSLGLLLALALPSFSCSERTAPATPPDDAPTGTAATAPAAPSELAALPPIDEAPHPEILREIAALIPRHACNRITGCSKVAGLLRHKAALIPAAKKALLDDKRPDGFWAIALTEALGQLGEPGATAVLVPLLDDSRWEIQLAAARGLAYLGPLVSQDAAQAIAKARAREDLSDEASVVRAALLEHALSRSGHDARPFATARAELLALLPSADKAPPLPQLDQLIRLIGEARLPEALPLVRHGLSVRNRFVTVTALGVAGSLQDTGSIPYALTLLDDPNPTIRREAILALQRITGARQLDARDQWLDWAKTHKIVPAPVSEPLVPGPQVIDDGP